MNPGGAALVDVSLALCVILSFVALCGVVMAPLRWIRAKLQAHAAARELHDRLASAAEHLPLPPKVPEIQIIPYQHEPRGPDHMVITLKPKVELYTVEDCRRREAECRAMSADGKARMEEHLKEVQGTGGTRRKVIMGYLEAEACRMRRGKQWSDQWALLAEAIEDAEEDGSK